MKKTPVVVSFLLATGIGTAAAFAVWGGDIIGSIQRGIEQRLAEIEGSIEETRPSEFDEDDMLRQLSQSGLLSLDLDSFRIVLASPEQVYLMSNDKEPEIPKATLALYQRLLDTKTGQNIRLQIRRFNDNRGIVAVRDDHSGGGVDCKSSIEPGSPWLARLTASGVRAETEAEPPLQMGFVSWDLASGFGPWSSVQGLGPDNRVTFYRDWLGGSRPLRIRSVGLIEELRIDGQPRHDLLRQAQYFCGSKSMQSGQGPICNPELAASVANRATWLVLPPEARGHIELVLRPSYVPPPQLPDDKFTETPAIDTEPAPQSQVELVPIAGSGALQIVQWTDPRQNVPLIGLDWVAPSQQRSAKRADWDLQILTADQELLFQGRGCKALKQRASELGLAATIGLGEKDPFSISGLVLGRTDGQVLSPVELSINSRLQAAAKAALQPVWQDQSNPRSRAALLVMRAGDDGRAGEIVAAAGLPSTIENFDLWDLRAAMEWRRGGSPLEPIGWRGGNSSTNPGSSFKGLTALAAMNAAEAGQTEILQLLGGVSEASSDSLGLPWNATGIEVPVWFGERFEKFRPISNFEYRPGEKETNRFGTRVPALSRQPEWLDCGDSLDPSARRLSLCGAMKVSLNTYFVRLAQLMDQAKLRVTGRDHEVPKMPKGTYFENALEAALPGVDGDLPGRWDLLHELWQRDGRPPPATSRLISEPLNVGLFPAQNELQHKLALNAIGQDVVALPVHIAALYAAIARGRPVLPSLISGGGGQSLGDASAMPSQASLEQLRSALWLVSNETNGTAFNSLGLTGDETPKRKALRQSLFAKTGTAEFGPVNETLNTAWFAGWIAPSIDGWRGDRLAFACMITHTDQTGGEACAPVVRDMFLALWDEPLQ